MNCRQFEDNLIAGGPLSADAERHLSTCPFCPRLYAALNEALPDDVPPPPVFENFEPAQPMAPTTLYAFVFFNVVLAIAALGVVLKGHKGWDALTVTQAAILFSGHLAAVVVATATLASAMRPGARFVFSPVRLQQFAIGLCALVIAVALEFHPTPLSMRYAIACFLLGIPFAVAGISLLWLLARRGYFADRPIAFSALGLVGGLTSVVFLQIYCPLLETGHMLAGHFLLPVAFATAGWFLAKRP